MGPALRTALYMLRRHGFKKGLSKAKSYNVPPKIIEEARLLAGQHPDRYLPKWHYMNKKRTAQKKDFEKTLKDYFDNLGGK
jgi:hypothetical protein